MAKKWLFGGKRLKTYFCHSYAKQLTNNMYN